MNKFLDSQFDQLEISVQTTRINNTFLHAAVELGMEDYVEGLLAGDPLLVLEVNKNGDTALHIAARRSLPSIARQLICCATRIGAFDPEYGEDYAVWRILTLANKDGDTAMHEAARVGSLEVVQLLTEAGPEVAYFANNVEDTPLYLATKHPQDIAKHMLDNLRSCAHGGSDGKTALHAAVLMNHSDTARKLLQVKPAIIKEADDQGWVPLHYAASMQGSSSLSICQLLLESNSSIACIQDKNGKSPLHVAASTGNDPVIKKLLEYCPNCWKVCDYEGRNFLHIATSMRKKVVVQEILKMKDVAKVCINQPDNDGNTALHLAAVHGPHDIFKLLQKHSYEGDKEREPDQLITTGTSPLGAGSMRSKKETINRQDLGEPLPKPKDEGPKLKKTLSLFDVAQKVSESHLVVAALIATVTFAAGFALPGGYKSDGPDKGMATLLRENAFRVFVISNTLAMMLSSLAVLIHFMMKLYVDHDSSHNVDSLVTKAFFCTLGAIFAMMLAFITGTYAVLAKSPGLAITACVLGCSFYLFAFHLLRHEFRFLLEVMPPYLERH